jgi:lipopolysaccharide/colanic/teichoic acid biosynthesis glycosyltransferase
MHWGHPDQGKVLLLAGDLVLAAAAAIFATSMEFVNPAAVAPRLVEIALFMLVFSACFYVFDLYDVRALNGARTIARLLVSAALGICIFSFFQFFLRLTGFGRVSMAISVPLLLVGSFIWRTFYRKNRTALLKRRGVLLIGTVEEAQGFHSVVQPSDSQYELLGLLRVREAAAAASVGALARPSAPLRDAPVASRSYQRAGAAAVAEIDGEQIPPANFDGDQCVQDFGVVNPGTLEELVLNRGVDTIVIRPDSVVTELAEVLTRLRFRGIRISTMPDLCSQILEKLPLETLSGAWFSFATGFNLLHARIFRSVKRLTDVLLACLGLLITLPISLAVAIAIKVESPGPVLFTQWRVGWREKPFRLLKFRSMRQDAEADGKAQWAAAKDPRATRVGGSLRRLHIDEIPQMINVLLGEMSFVGPRPERPVFVEQLKSLVPFYHLRHYVPPGITGWAQVNYPYGDCVEDAKKKLQYDLYYVRHASPSLDLRILLRTARVVLFRSGSR